MRRMPVDNHVHLAVSVVQQALAEVDEHLGGSCAFIDREPRRPFAVTAEIMFTDHRARWS